MKKKIKFIGVIHMSPLLGYEGFPGYDVAIKNAIEDLRSYQDGGVDAVIIENNYDVPHKEYLDSEQIVAFGKILGEVIKEAKVPFGISVLWNDYKSALSLAVTYNCDFIRVPVFVDTVKTEFGIMHPVYKELGSFKKSIGAESIKVLVDIHVKHSVVLSEYTLNESAKMAMENGADGIIITGVWTGTSPNVPNVVDIHDLDPNIPIYLGSGITAENVNQYSEYITGVIVSTSLKEEVAEKHKQNIKPYSTRIEKAKVVMLAKEIEKIK
jgi:membrane complex biogenesis BtpA family protein